MTGGMGAYCPAPVVTSELLEQIERDILVPTVDGLLREGIEYRGVLYAGLMLTPDGPKVLEFNVRFGDPEAQVVLPRIEGDLTALLASAARGALESAPAFGDMAAVCVVMASEGYPDRPQTGAVISGLDRAVLLPDVVVFHAGTGTGTGTGSGTTGAGGAGGAGGGTLVTAGGRVLGVTALGATLDEARAAAYGGVAAISWPGAQFRSDIALQEAARPLAPSGAPAAPPAGGLR